MLIMPPAGRNGLRIYTIRRRIIDLSEPYIEPRGAIDAEIELPDRRLRVIVTHLGLRMRERYRQACKLRTALAAAPGHPAVLLGDFNDWFPTKPTLKPLTDLCRRTASPRSYPSRRPVPALDQVMLLGIGTVEVSCHRSPLSRIASDHLPVVGQLRG